MRLAVEEINQSQNLLPNFSLGYKIFDSCATHVTGQRAALAVLNGPDLAQSVMYGRGTRSRPGSGRIVNIYSKRKSEARLSEFAKAQNHKAESLSLVVALSLNQ